MKWEIKHRITNNVIYTAEGETLKEVVLKAIRDNANLRYADLSSADLRSADLRSANLSSADLRYADLSSADLSSADLRYANLSSADLRYADLRYADLRSADLSSANLSSADLSSTDLSSADLRYADLRYADLRYANLRYAKNISKYLTTNLYLLKDQPGLIRAYKLVNSDNIGPFNGGIKYELEKSYEVLSANTDEQEQFGEGINVADLPWCIKEFKEGYKILIVEFEAKDIASIPIGSDGKLRLFRCKVVGEKDLKELGLVKQES